MFLQDSGTWLNDVIEEKNLLRCTIDYTLFNRDCACWHQNRWTRLYIFSAKQGFSPLLPEKTLKSRLNCDITLSLAHLRFLHQATKQNNPDDRYWKIKITLLVMSTQNFINYFPFVFSVCLKWRLFDPKIAAWLLNPDHPPQSFAEVLNSAQLSLPKVNSCITYIPCL